MEELQNKIQELAKEASELSNVKFSLQKQLKEIDTRLTQISGAIIEIQKIQQKIGESNGCKVSGNSESEVSRGISKADQEQNSVEDGVQAKKHS